MMSRKKNAINNRHMISSQGYKQFHFMPDEFSLRLLPNIKYSPSYSFLCWTQIIKLADLRDFTEKEPRGREKSIWLIVMRQKCNLRIFFADARTITTLTAQDFIVYKTIYLPCLLPVSIDNHPADYYAAQARRRPAVPSSQHVGICHRQRPLE